MSRRNDRSKRAKRRNGFESWFDKMFVNAGYEEKSEVLQSADKSYVIFKYDATIFVVDYKYYRIHKSVDWSLADNIVFYFCVLQESIDLNKAKIPKLCCKDKTLNYTLKETKVSMKQIGVCTLSCIMILIYFGIRRVSNFHINFRCSCTVK